MLFRSINDPRGPARSGKNNFGNGFLPAAFQGTDFNAKNPPSNLSRPASYTSADDRSTVSLLQRLNGFHLEKYPGDADLAARIASYELAGKMQTSIPDVMDISKEPASIKKEYGLESGTDLKKEYAKNCILARRLLEKECVWFSCLMELTLPGGMELLPGTLIAILIRPIHCRR